MATMNINHPGPTWHTLKWLSILATPFELDQMKSHNFNRLRWPRPRKLFSEKTIQVSVSFLLLQKKNKMLVTCNFLVDLVCAIDLSDTDSWWPFSLLCDSRYSQNTAIKALCGSYWLVWCWQAVEVLPLTIYKDYRILFDRLLPYTHEDTKTYRIVPYSLLFCLRFNFGYYLLSSWLLINKNLR
jgi:hypothetical protein